MNLKKIGSALTAISMIASMATYVPFTASATDPVTVSGTLKGVNYVLDYTTKSESTLTLSDGDGDGKYVIPLSIYQDDSNHYETIIDYVTDQHGITDVTVKTLVVQDNATGVATQPTSDEDDTAVAWALPTGASKVAEIEYDCRTTGSVLTNYGTTLTETHDKYGENKKHYCHNCDWLSNSYSEHDFKGKKATVSKGVHTCECGVTSEELYDATKPADASANANYLNAHDFGVSNTEHICKTTGCGAYNKVVHANSSNVEYTKTATKHTVTCKSCSYAETAQNHSFVADTDNHQHKCSVCSYVDVDANSNPKGHNFDSKYIVNTAGTATIVKTTNADEQVVCACGAVDTTKHPDTIKHEFLGQNGKHICICGRTSSQHAYEYVFDNKGSNVIGGITGFSFVGEKDSSNNQIGIVCRCGDIINAKVYDEDGNETVNHSSAGSDSNHMNETAFSDAVVDKTNHLHYCQCGKLYTVSNNGVNVPKHETNPADIDKVNHLHKCVCGEVVDAHDYDSVWEVSGGSFAETNKGSGSGIICSACKETKPGHTHSYIIGYAGKDYCACGISRETHDWVLDAETQEYICSVCDSIKDHHHTYKDDCTCTNPNCPNYGDSSKADHDYQPVAGKGYHRCTRCGVTSSAAGVHTATVFDKTAHTHKCACGADVTVHNYTNADGTTSCVCLDCDYDNHTRKNNTGKTKCECTTCGKEVPHKVNPTTHKCTKCDYIEPHTCAFASNASSASTGIAAGDELCACDAKIEHKIVLDTTTLTKHKCATTGCDYATRFDDTRTHNFGTASAAKDQNDYCADCGAVNVDKLLADAVAVYTQNKLGATGESYTGKYSSAYVVELNNEAKDVLAYDWKTSYTTPARPVDDADVLTAKTTAEKTKFANELKEFNDVLNRADSNKAGDSIVVDFVTGCNTMGTAKDLTIVGIAGKTADITVTANDGYKFVGWFTDKAGTKPVEGATEGTYTATFGHGAVTYYAKLAANDKVQIDVKRGTGFTAESNITYTTPVTATNDESLDVCIGEEVTLKFDTTADANTKFVAFRNTVTGETLKATLSTTVYVAKFIASESASFECVTYSVAGLSAASKIYVVFKNYNGEKVLKNATVAETAPASGKYNAAAVAPVAPTLLGNNFVGWAKEGPTSNVPVLMSNLGSGDGGIYVPYYEPKTGITLKVTNGTIKPEDEKETYTYGDKVQLAAKAKDSKGKYFSGWYVGDERIETALQFIYSIPEKNVEVVAKYEGNAPLEENNPVRISVTSRTEDTNGQYVKLKGTWKEIEGATKILEKGYLFSFTGADLAYDKVNNSSVRKKTVSNDYDEYSYTMQLKSSPNDTVTAKTYVRYLDSNGKVQIAYSTNTVTSVGLN